MQHVTALSNFVRNGNYSEDNVAYLLEDLDITKKQLIKRTFKYLNSQLGEFRKNDYYIQILSNTVDLIYLLCNEQDFTEEEVQYNRERIKKARETILSYANKHKNMDLYDMANKLDEIILDKNVSVEDMLKLIKALIERYEDVDIIKKFINTNKGSIIVNNSELFEFVFQKTLDALEKHSEKIYYYITLLKLTYNSKIDRKKYVDRLDELKQNNIFTYEIYLIINGFKRGLTPDEIFEKYELIEKLQSPKIILPKPLTPTTPIITIDRSSKTMLRDDALSIKKDGNNYIVGIHITDAASQIEYDGIEYKQAKNNYRCVYMGGEKSVRMFSQPREKSLSLDERKPRKTISLYVIMNNSGDILDYYIQEDEIIVSKNLSYLQSEDMLNYLSDTGFEQSIYELFLLASALEKKNPIRREYWEKKEQSSGDAKKKPTNFKSDVIVREFMVLYNQLLAMNAKEMKIPYTYRTQEEEYISGLITDLDIKLDDTTKKILKGIYLESKYTHIPTYHNGLGVECYSHSGDPSRRFGDLYNQYLMHQFYFNDIDIAFDYDDFLKQIEYFNQRNEELALMKSEYTRQYRLTKKH